MKVCVIGAGASGLITGHTLRNEGFDVTIYERNTYIGGVWKYIPPVINSEYDVQTKTCPMYRDLITNLPNEIMAFSEEIRFDSSLPSFLTHTAVQSYLEDFFKQSDLEQFVLFSTEVTNCKRCDTSNTWSVESQNKISMVSFSESYDFVVVCNGHFDEPNIPDIQGKDTFLGKQIHAREYDNASAFSGLRVLVVGSRSSGTDIAREVSNTATQVCVSDRSYDTSSCPPHLLVKTLQATTSSPVHEEHSDSMRVHPTENEIAAQKKFVHMPGIKRIVSHSSIVEFVDGRTFEADVIVWATGYLYRYPFLKSIPKYEQINEPKLRVLKWGDFKLTEEGDTLVPELFQQLFYIPEPSLVFVGLPYKIAPFSLFRVQALVVAKVFSRKAALPSKQDMYNWLQLFEFNIEQTHGDVRRLYHCLGGVEQHNYLKNLLSWIGLESDHRLMAFIDFIMEIYLDNSAHRPEYVGAPDLYRRRNYDVDWQELKWTVKPLSATGQVSSTITGAGGRVKAPQSRIS